MSGLNDTMKALKQVKQANDKAISQLEKVKTQVASAKKKAVSTAKKSAVTANKKRAVAAKRKGALKPLFSDV